MNTEVPLSHPMQVTNTYDIFVRLEINPAEFNAEMKGFFAQMAETLDNCCGHDSRDTSNRSIEIPDVVGYEFTPNDPVSCLKLIFLHETSDRKHFIVLHLEYHQGRWVPVYLESSHPLSDGTRLRQTTGQFLDNVNPNTPLGQSSSSQT